MEIQDDRTPEQRETHPILVVGTDPVMTRWGIECGRIPAGGKSYAAWACKDGEASRCQEWVEARKDMRRIRVTADPYRPRGRGHLHIYLWDSDTH